MNHSGRPTHLSASKKSSAVPGPGAYENVLAMNSTGRYPATYVPQTLTRRIVDTKLPAAVNTTVTPGPGHYTAPSDFGIYVSARFLTKLRQ